MRVIKYTDLMNIHGLEFRDWDAVALCAVVSHAIQRAMSPDVKLDTPTDFVERVLRNGRVETSRIIDREGIGRMVSEAKSGEDGWETHPNFRKPLDIPTLDVLQREAENVLKAARARLETEK